MSGGETLPLSITSNTSWTAASDATWLTLSALSGTGTGSESIDVEATANTTVSVRTATITITDGGSLTRMVSVSQAAGDATLTVSPDPLTFVSGGETLPLSIMSNTSWTASSDADWLTLSVLSGTGTGSESINVEATANTTVSERTATITITDDGGSLTETVSVTQAAMPMISFASATGDATDDATSPSDLLEVSLTVSDGGFGAATDITITVATTTGTIADGDYTLAVSGGVDALSGNHPTYTLNVPATQPILTLSFTTDDADNEGEVVTLTLSSADAVIGTEDVHTITITDEDVVAMLTITDISPAEGAVETTVTITGTGFDATPTNNMVTFLGDESDSNDDVEVLSSAISSASTTELQVSVPTGAATGKISVTVGAETATSAVFTVVLPGGGPNFSVTGSERGLQIYPNPTYGEVRFAGLSALRSYQYKVYTLVGQRGASGILQGDKAIDLSILPSGQYVLVLEDEENSEVLRTRLLVLK